MCVKTNIQFYRRLCAQTLALLIIRLHWSHCNRLIKQGFCPDLIIAILDANYFNLEVPVFEQRQNFNLCSILSISQVKKKKKLNLTWESLIHFKSTVWGAVPTSAVCVTSCVCQSGGWIDLKMIDYSTSHHVISGSPFRSSIKSPVWKHRGVFPGGTGVPW